MDTEHRKVLDMLAEGKISAADAERLLSKLAGSAEDLTIETPADETTTGSRPLKYLRVVVDSTNGDKGERPCADGPAAYWHQALDDDSDLGG